MSKLRVEKVYKQYNRRFVVNGISIEISRGEIVGFLGPNGSGKTTTFYIIVGIVSPDGGNVFFDDKNITNLPIYKRAQLGIGYLPQEHSVFRSMSVEDNVKCILELKGYIGKELNKRTDEVLDYMGLTKVRKTIASALSGGEKRRLEVARMIALEPSFLLLDEPFTGIDPIAINDIQNIVRMLREDKNIGVLITDHNVRETLKIVDRAYIIHNGEIMIEGDAGTLINDPKAREIYLGQSFDI
ncbi:MAG: LPS export ABC transporter ATP-binding protein [Spirochaetia bacterium]|nr:LPS export ABC transporter ATP-binding protein [Spirochaetota bacterium]MCX8096832.1 LPS export ABC transporter ATP-binding protein [Spirochaetota bacterium]MDW8112801.1 LPS export ABC transporter ATP-binding protein [Spirochaetia bacterium]